MLPADLHRLALFPARLIVTAADRLPEQPGVYLFFFRGGSEMLSATSYFDLERVLPLNFRNRQHLYTGSAYNLRRRLKQHMKFIWSSNLRLSLLSIEHERQAISKSNTPDCDVRGERTLTAWLCKNATIGIEVVDQPVERERALLSQYASPLNLTLRRQQPYARALSEMRRSAFPKGDGHRINCLREL